MNPIPNMSCRAFKAIESGVKRKAIDFETHNSVLTVQFKNAVGFLDLGRLVSFHVDISNYYWSDIPIIGISEDATSIKFGLDNIPKGKVENSLKSYFNDEEIKSEIRKKNIVRLTFKDDKADPHLLEI